MNVSALSSYAAHLPIDWIIFGIIAAVVIFLTYRTGAAIAASIALAALTALVVYSAVPHAVLVASLLAPLPQAMVFLAIFIGAYLLCRRMVGSEFGAVGSPIPSILAGLAVAAVLFTLWQEVQPLQGLWAFGPQVRGIFSESYRLWWLIGSLAALAFARS